MPPLAAELAGLLDVIRRPGDFQTSGLSEILAPRLEVRGVGPIALPLLTVQAELLIAAAEQAPYGRGAQTLVDTEVRRAWQIDADMIEIGGQGWARSLAAIVTRVADGLGVTDPITAELYKMLIYEPGGFFVSHRDTEKVPGMFATLVVVLPSDFTGGELVIRHKDREARLDLHAPEPSEVAFAAFYADCHHEILPVTSGHRLALVYNLSRQGRGATPKIPSYDHQQADLTRLLANWAADRTPGRDGATAPIKLIYPLEHVYTDAGLAFDTLKGADAARAATLAAAAEAADCDLHLALLTIEESGSAEFSGDYRSYRDDDYDDDDFEIGEVFDRDETLSEWRRLDGRDTDLGPLPFDEDEISPPDALEDMEPDALSFEEATGNAGASFERRYRRAALVLWPRHGRLAVINQGGLDATLPFLAELVDRWIDGDEGQASPVRAEALELVGHMIGDWSPRHRAPGKVSDAAIMLGHLDQLGDLVLVDRFLAEQSATGAYGADDNVAIQAAIRRLPAPRAVELLTAIAQANAAGSFAAVSDLLARAARAIASRKLKLTAADLGTAAHALVAALPGDPTKAPEAPYWRRPSAPEPHVVADLLTALTAIDEALAATAIGRILAWRDAYELDGILVPAMLKLSRAVARTPSGAALREACLAHLGARIAAPLAPPSDWTRPHEVKCKCAHCAALSRFLADPASGQWAFKALQNDRLHVEHTIRESQCDVDYDTVRKGSPHTLLCTKTQASYQRRVSQREQDLKDRAEIEAKGR